MKFNKFNKTIFINRSGYFSFNPSNQSLKTPYGVLTTYLDVLFYAIFSCHISDVTLLFVTVSYKKVKLVKKNPFKSLTANAKACGYLTLIELVSGHL